MFEQSKNNTTPFQKCHKRIRNDECLNLTIHFHKKEFVFTQMKAFIQKKRKKRSQRGDASITSLGLLNTEAFLN